MPPQQLDETPAVACKGLQFRRSHQGNRPNRTVPTRTNSLGVMATFLKGSDREWLGQAGGELERVHGLFRYWKGLCRDFVSCLGESFFQVLNGDAIPESDGEIRRCLRGGLETEVGR